MINLINFCQPINLTCVFSKFYIILLICFVFKNFEIYKGVTSSLLLLMKKKYRYFFISFAIIICSIFLLDFKISKFCSEYYDNNLKSMLSILTDFGKWYLVFGFFALLSIVSMLFKRHSLEVLFKISALACLYAEFFNFLIKLIFMRTRPYKSLEPTNFFSYVDFLHYQFREIIHNINSTYSMASGHVINTVATATVLYLYVKNIFIRAILVLWVITIFISRVYLLSHWLSDVLVAVVLGYAIGYVMYQKHKDILIRN